MIKLVLIEMKILNKMTPDKSCVGNMVFGMYMYCFQTVKWISEKYEGCPAARTEQMETVLSATQLERIFYSREA